ncbi:hypothetical protein PPERSA_02718 [Pseudocohnilembus persalinus]|uniref:Uncharacterized protein n=1 Tax=Pseudocohnilembus persalinus TaxID=266149 RepID=A0A0V0R5R2_PSEPJ|nr:hypothetical protein PPERSA_02718 [Pseudocohnilembus persalinus]|eukprot:KRX09846.1 hypothetical protein PPERSA_02718 [Pseudocohnilembus persalinus]
MTDQTNMQCKIEGHQNLKFLYLNMSSDNKQDFFSCPICIQQQFMDTKQNPDKHQKTLILIEQLQNDQLKSENLTGWPPIQNNNHQQIYQNHLKNMKEQGQENDYQFNYFKKQIIDFFNNFQKQIINEIQKQQKETIIQLQNYCNYYFQNQDSDQEFNSLQEIIKKFDVKEFREKFLEFQQNKIDIDQLFDYKQQQNCQVYNNNKLYDSLKTQQEKVEEMKDDLEKEFAKINDSIASFRKYQPSLKKIPQQQQIQQQQQQQPTKKQQQLKFYKSDFNSYDNKGKFEIDNDARTIKFKSDWYTHIYSENLQQEKEYHLRFTMDTKNNVENIFLAFSLTSGNKKNSKSLLTDHYVTVFYYNGNSSAKGGEFKVEGKEKFTEFFKDKQTIMNVVFNIEKQFMEIYDDDKISYQKLTFNQNNNNFEEQILGIYYNKIGISQVDIQFID